MTLFGNFFKRVKASYQAVKEGVSRSIIANPVQNSTRDNTAWTRKKLISKSRYFYENSPIYTLIIERLVAFTIGSGLSVSPKTDDDEFNKAAAAVWADWCKDPDITSELDFTALQGIICRSIFIDGDCLTVKVLDGGAPRLQCFESHAVAKNLGLSWLKPDGVELDPLGRVLGYHVMLDETKPYSTVLVDLNDCILHSFPKRLNQYRGVPVASSALITMHDIDDVIEYEKMSVKELSARALAVKRVGGEDDENPINALKGNSDEGMTVEESKKYYEELSKECAADRSKIMVLNTSDDLVELQNNRPSPAWQGFMQLLIESCCHSTAIAPSVILGNKVGGADTRRDLMTAERVISKWQSMISRQFQEIYEFVIGFNIAKGVIKNAPANWRKTKWQFPPKASVDAGRDGNNDRSDVEAGLMSREQHYARRGLDWRSELAQIAREEKEMQDLRLKMGLSPKEKETV